MAEVDPLQKLLTELQHDRNPRLLRHIEDARALTDLAERDFPTSPVVVCVHHELVESQMWLDDLGHGGKAIEMAQRFLPDPALPDGCRVCLLKSQSEAALAKGDPREADALLRAAISVCRKMKSKFRAIRDEAYCLWRVSLVSLIRFGDARALEDIDAHDLQQRRVINYVDQLILERPEWADDPGLAHVVVNANESLREIDIIRQCAQGRHAEALASIRRYLDELGDGGSGMAMVIHTFARHLGNAQDWDTLLDASPLLVDELKRRQRQRWLASLLIDTCRAHMAAGDRRAARVALFQIDEIRGDLVHDDLAGPVGALEGELSLL